MMYPKPEPKEKKQFGFSYWNDIRSKSFKKRVAANKDKTDKLDKWYHAIHEKFNYECQETGNYLTYSKKHAHHILPKKDYPYFMFDLDNGILVSWSVHHILDWGSEKQKKELKIYPFIEKRKKELLAKLP